MIKPRSEVTDCCNPAITFGGLMFKKTFVFTLFAALAGPLASQVTYPVNGVHDERPIYHAFTNATIYVTPAQKLDRASLLIKEGKIVEAGTGITLPKGTVVHDCSGLVIYASFIDIYSGINFKKGENKKEQGQEAPVTHKDAGNWNPAIHPEYEYKQVFPVEEKIREDWLASGIGVVNVHHRDGIMRGTSSCFHVGIDQPNEALINDAGANHYSFSKGSSKHEAPTSFVGAVALIRQTFYDAEWYAKQSAPQKETNPSLAALNYPSTRHHIFELNHSLSVRNVQDIATEFQLDFVLKGAGMEYLVLDELKKETRMILPLSFPKAYDLKDPYEARMVSLKQMKHWEAAPFNPYFLHNAGVSFCLSRDTLKNAAAFLTNLRKVTESGLNHENTLRALTVNPAAFIGLGDVLGTLEKGKYASFIITNKRLDEKDFRVVEHWNKGIQVYSTPEYGDMVGKYNLVIDRVDYEVSITSVKNKEIKATAARKGENKKLKITIERERDLLTLILQTEDSIPQLLYRLSGKLSLNGGIWDGKGQDAQGKWVDWGAVKSREKTEKPAPDQRRDSLKVPELWHPNQTYGWDTLDTKSTFVLTNATVWTAADTGILKNADIYVVDGKIKAVGSNMFYPTEVRRINANGKHVTPGIIDEHSHIALRGGVNERGMSSSAEVRMGDALDPWNINIYRQLAGGVTTAQLLHGSLNPIGGQSALVKLKWGRSADEMLIDNAPGFVKFALGENVKRTNKGHEDARFPLTRMGVEQAIADAFVRAKEYDRELSAPQVASGAGKKSKPQPATGNVRKDLELETLREVLKGERFITCHSYVQSEILMLMALADSLGFKVNTFTHVLEGYKVCDELAEHGANASTFSDWWAYKFEVNDAIPYNAAMLTHAGINTAINSDDAEMGRRLNQEAAKTMKYGGLSEEEAIRLITINPARMLHLDQRIGSIEAGKDADFVIWSGNPLSVYSEVEKTFIEGVPYFDASKQKAQNEAIESERARITQLMLRDQGKEKRKAKPDEKPHYHCDTLIEETEE